MGTKYQSDMNEEISSYTRTYRHDNALLDIAGLAAKEVAELRAEVDRLTKLINTPITDDFMKALPLEAAHQQYKWGVEHDAGKNCLDWYWLIGYLSQKIVVYEMAGNHDKALHHCITVAAVMLNWHRNLQGEGSMRPGVARPVSTSEVTE